MKGLEKLKQLKELLLTDNQLTDVKGLGIANIRNPPRLQQVMKIEAAPNTEGAPPKAVFKATDNRIAHILDHDQNKIPSSN